MSQKEKLLKSIENIKNHQEAMFEFNEQQLEAIEKAKEEIVEGKTISNEAVNKEIEEWLLS